MGAPRFAVALPPSTEKAATEFVRTVLDPQIDELSSQLELLQAHRRSLASTFGIDRREGATQIGKLLDAASRAEYEGKESVE